MSELFLWTGGLRPLAVTIVRRTGPGLLPDEWEVCVVEAQTKVLVRSAELQPAPEINGSAA